MDFKPILKKLGLLPLASKLTRTNAMAKKCHECSGEYFDGKEDCESITCPMYAWMNYRKKTPNFEWLKFNPKKKGRVTWEESAREITDEQRAAMGARLQKARNKNDV
jgi:hypothetical protein